MGWSIQTWLLFIPLVCGKGDRETSYMERLENFNLNAMNSTSFWTADCHEAFVRGDIRDDSVYFLELQPSRRIVEAICQFDSNAGWTVIQRRLNGSVDFYRNWTEYTFGFGKVDGEYWLGLENIHLLSMTNTKLSVYLESHEGEQRTANYSSFQVHNSTTSYKLQVSGFTGDAGDSLSYNSPQGSNGQKFSTYDVDNDMFPTSCAVTYSGAWWYNSCHMANLNGKWYPQGNATSYATGAVWSSWKGQYYSYKTIYMRISK